MVALFVFLLSNLNDDNNNDRVETNDGITKVESFSITSEHTDLKTSVDGTIFYNGKQASAQIVALFYIDPLDWGGVAFYFPSGWHISGVKSSYPQGNQEVDPSDSLTILTTKSENVKWSTYLEISREFIAASKHSGGYGYVVIDLAYQDDELERALKFAVSIGSRIKDGIKIIGTDNIEINLE
ncbi:hypothetical protein BK133_28070 [Paenibacillus sp. FSL H8-0548]|uniref:hypothetical protein n=1 Tax=Paenibacillus sp. FSL H8-0548 TaxID=1920422 RepID=UPI00096C544C|nr:hypothetical protein [Paenibacillus sp. FSL H8-0548]OMF21652.1 hypothetical protein BK133_28070 [Paenibacillus sp. FSL H8-0548]